jgi:hypothetical protein
VSEALAVPFDQAWHWATTTDLDEASLVTSLKKLGAA